MRTNAQVADVAAHIVTYLQRAASGEERFVAVQDGRPLAGVVSAEDVARLEALDAVRQGSSASAEREAAFQRGLEAAGLVVQWPTGPAVPLHERIRLPIEGSPLSEQIIADRR
jgi:antitoxin (DNA-binding transcriptional repressor) of toxin-antitoxin stability system